MKFFADFLPIVVFFVIYKFYGIYAATAATIFIALIQFIISWYKYRKIQHMQLIIVGTVVILGGATLIFHNDLFIKWKPTIINWALAITFLCGQWITKKPLIQHLMQNNIELPNNIWARINTSWIVFFSAIGTTNLYVAYFFDTNTWVNFKLFGVLGATLVFVIGQAVYLSQKVSR